MLKRFLSLTTCCFILCLLIIAGTCILARRDPPPRVAALLPDPSCEPPCWMGFRPGYIQIDALQTWIDNPPGDWQLRDISSDTTAPGHRDWLVMLPDEYSFKLTIVRFDNPQVDRLVLWPEDLALGDVNAIFGEPDFIDFNTGFDAQNWRVLEFRAYYQEQRLIAIGVVRLKYAALFPDTPVSGLVYEAKPWGRPFLAFDWLGFGSLTRYYPQGVSQ